MWLVLLVDRQRGLPLVAILLQRQVDRPVDLLRRCQDRSRHLGKSQVGHRALHLVAVDSQWDHQALRTRATSTMQNVTCCGPARSPVEIAAFSGSIVRLPAYFEGSTCHGGYPSSCEAVPRGESQGKLGGDNITLPQPPSPLLGIATPRSKFASFVHIPPSPSASLSPHLACFLVCICRLRSANLCFPGAETGSLPRRRSLS